MVLAMADEPDAVEPYDAALDRARRKGSVFEVAASHLFRGQALLLRGELPAAIESLRSGSEALDLWGIEAGRAYPSAFLASALIECGDVESARVELGRAGILDDPDAVFGDPTWALFWWCEARARLALADGATELALRWLDCAADSFVAIGGANPAWLPWRSRRAQVLERLGNHQEALALATEELDAARAWGAPRALGRALRVLGELRDNDALELLQEAVEVLEGSTAQLEQARALAALGRALRLARRPTDAREPLRRALQGASVCEAAPLVELVRGELHATGARPRSDALSGVGALTPSERRIAALAAAGQTNRGIAQELYVTPKTVEVHLSNVYRKLSIRSRRELPTVLAA